MRKWTLALYALASLALAASSLPEWATSGQWGDGQVYKFAAPAPERSYTVYALSRPTSNPSRILRPRTDGGAVVKTASQTVTLSTQQPAQVTQVYTDQEVAYFDLTFTVSTRDGNFYRNGQQILTKSGSDYGNLLWGTLWTVSFGLISLFWIPSTTQTLHYTEIIPLNSPPIHYTFGGGGNCFSLGTNSAGFWIDPSRLQPGYVYPMYANVRCLDPTGGIWTEFGLLASIPTVQWNQQGLLPRYKFEFVSSPAQGFDLFAGNPSVAPGQFARNYSSPYGNQYSLHSGGTLPDSQHPTLPTSLPSFQVDRMWTLRDYADSGSTKFVAPFDQVTLCLQRDPDYPKSCDSSATYRRTSASPPGPVSVSPQWGFPATYVGQSVSRGPRGEDVSQPYVQYSIPSQTLTLTDTFQCVAGSCP